jgi:hypothetical protein
MHTAAVFDVQEDVVQVVNPIETVAEVSGRPKCNPSTTILAPDVVGPLKKTACDMAGAS